MNKNVTKNNIFILNLFILLKNLRLKYAINLLHLVYLDSYLCLSVCFVLLRAVIFTILYT